MLFNKLGWLNTYLPFIVPAAFATYSFFIFMLVQFIRGIPRELDEAARIDGCGPWSTLVNIILPLCKPALVSCVIFQFVWRWNDFLNPLIYISSVKKYPLSLAPVSYTHLHQVKACVAESRNGMKNAIPDSFSHSKVLYKHRRQQNCS